jgi:hypothetical protein
MKNEPKLYLRQRTGEVHTAEEWEGITGIRRDTIRQRFIRGGWDNEDIFTVTTDEAKRRATANCKTCNYRFRSRPETRARPIVIR